jgi:hypothetical protein
MGKENKSLITSMTPEDIQNTIEKYLPVRDDKKNKNGEVFTPIELIKEMLDKLPSSVWTNPDLKWLDPANGIGNFPMVVYQKLLEKLPDKYSGANGSYSGEAGKKKHIIEKMLYMVELDAANIKISRRIFGKDANISCGSFLEDKWKKEFNDVDKFDIIMGNPPFNASQENVGKKGGGDSLWPKFITTSLDMLVNNGYLVFVHPSAWRKPESDNSKTIGLFNIMAHDNHIHYLEIHDTKDGMNIFNVSTRYDWYVLQKHRNNSDTIIKDQMGVIDKIDLSVWNFLPNHNIDKIKKLLSNSEQHYVMYSRNQYGTDKNWTNSDKTTEYKYPLIHSTPASGVRYYWTSTKNPSVKNPIEMFGVPKVIFGESGNLNNVIIDIEGKYGLTQEAIGLKIKNAKEGDLYKNALLSAEFKDILSAMSFGNFRIDWRMFKYFKPDFYKYFSNKEKARTKINQFVTKKFREKKLKTNKIKSVSKGGKRRTKKISHNKKTRRR